MQPRHVEKLMVDANGSNCPDFGKHIYSIKKMSLGRGIYFTIVESLSEMLDDAIQTRYVLDGDHHGQHHHA